MSRAISDEAFLDNLEEIFLAEGFRSIKIGDLASRLKCSRRRFYEYAGGKEELFLLVCGRIFKRVQDVGWQRAHDEPDIIKKIGAYLSAGIEGAQRMSAVFQEDIGSFAGGRDLYDDHQRKRIDGLRSLVEDGIAQGVFRNLNSYLVAEITLM
ncbi:MAG: TetR/AcrR family transcriptional regulator, partial [Pseudomonadota bacterium]